MGGVSCLAMCWLFPVVVLAFVPIQMYVCMYVQECVHKGNEIHPFPHVIYAHCCSFRVANERVY